MYARGMSTREIVGHLRDLYGIEVSPDLISAVTDAVLEEVAAWQARPLEATYPLVLRRLRVRSAMKGWSVTRRCTSRSGCALMAPRRSWAVARAERGREVLAAGDERAEEPRCRGRADRRRRRPQGLPGGDHRRLPQATCNLHRPLLRHSLDCLLERPQAGGGGAQGYLPGCRCRSWRSCARCLRGWPLGQEIPGDRPELAAPGARSSRSMLFPAMSGGFVHHKRYRGAQPKLRRAVRARGHFPSDEAATSCSWS